ncbi:hypothetical protein GS491_19095 [Rhodococcus hoagii]|uniref:hypothetical protein n=1 Tax=Rhodococcus hoagii TaxID=43767 RepID=UPI0007CD6206|nr:hypothetical protein [Prescottella equi]NKR79442.1 hypothetical protein [Prescottella equi]NKT01822.1 hypothetical protein [Prescottella equi]
MTIEISDGVTVTVNVPNRMPTICPATTPGGPITVPVQGGLTAEQLAHIVATVTAKVVEELGGQPGGGGAGIDDTTIGTDTTWSSQKTSDELAGKADDKSWMIDTETGDLMPGPFPSLSYQVALAYAWANLALKATSEFGDGTVGGVEIVSALPEYPSEGTLYAVRVSDGTISWHMPNIGG